ncbi:DUF1801 domain-containing protein [Povalibacter uvarum]|nr:DUF1801 domain-containing protein [Povalibacter uvarum]
MKTQPTGASVNKFIAAVDNEQRRKDAKVVVKLMQEATGEKAKMWGPSIVGFGLSKLTYADGRETQFLLIGFSPRKTDLVLYIGAPKFRTLLKGLGRFKTGKSCLYIKKLEDVDIDVLKELIEAAVESQAKMRVRAS